jgi:hypothetical protein
LEKLDIQHFKGIFDRLIKLKNIKGGTLIKCAISSWSNLAESKIVRYASNQNLKYLSQKTKYRANSVFSRRFGRYSFSLKGYFFGQKHIEFWFALIER